MEQINAPRKTNTFTVRVWAEAIGKDAREWRGEVRHLASGATYYFRDWHTLTTRLTQLVESDEAMRANLVGGETSERD